METINKKEVIVTSFKAEFNEVKNGVFVTVFNDGKEIVKCRMDYGLSTSAIKKTIQFENTDIEFTFPRGSLKQIKMYVDNESIKNKRLSIDD